MYRTIFACATLMAAMPTTTTAMKISPWAEKELASNLAETVKGLESAKSATDLALKNARAAQA